MNQKTKGIVLVLTAACLWGCMGIIVRGLNGLGYSSVDIAFIRCISAGVGFCAYQKIKTPDVLRIDKKGILIGLLYGVIACGISYIGYGFAVQRIPVAVATVLMFLNPAWVAIFGKIFFKDILGRVKICGVIVCLIGAILVSDVLHIEGVRLDILGILAAIANSLGRASQILIPRYFADRYSRDSMLIYGFFGGALFLIPGIDGELLLEGFSSGMVGQFVLYGFCAGILCTMVANVFYVKASMYIDTTTTSILAAIEIVVSVVIGAFVFHEVLNILQTVGIVVVMLGASVPPLWELFGNGECGSDLEQAVE